MIKGPPLPRPKPIPRHKGLLEKQTSVVVIETKPELNYMVTWCHENGKNVSRGVLNIDGLPICLCISERVVGWTKEMDRALDYISFNRFLSEIGRG